MVMLDVAMMHEKKTLQRGARGTVSKQ